MKIFPECQHLRITMYCSSLLGIWPFIFENYPTWQKLYRFYSNSMIVYYCFFICTAYVKLVQILTSDKISLSETSSNLCITLIYTCTIIRQLMLRANGVKKMIRYIIDMEKEIYEFKDPEIIKIYDECANETVRLSKIYLGILFIITINFFIHPLFVEPYVFGEGNETVVIKNLPLSSWFPIDSQKHYTVAYLWHILDGSVGASFVTYTDILMFSIIVYPTGQLQILQHVFRNFQKYKEFTKKKFGIENDRDAAVQTFMECYFMHMKIIEYIDDFNISMKNLMIFDFLQASLQIASILTQLIGLELTLMTLVYVGCFLIGMILRLILYYYFANEIILLSQGLSYAAWESDWYTEEPEVKFMIFMFMMRSKKGLKLLIGPFSVMSLDSLISILKATYSYLMLMYGLK